MLSSEFILMKIRKKLLFHTFGNILTKKDSQFGKLTINIRKNLAEYS